MREIVSPLDGFLSPFGRISGADAYAIGGASPELVAAFTLASNGTTAGEYFRKAGSETTFDGLFTHSASSNATMVDSDGLLKWRPHNLLTYSEQFDNAAWAKAGATVSGSTVTATAGTSTHRVSQVSGLSGVVLSVEVTALRGTHDYFQVYDGASLQNYATFDLSNGTVGAFGTNTTASVVSNTDGSYTCKVVYGLAFSTNGNTLIGLADSASSGWGSSWTATGSETIILRRATVYRSDLGGMVNNPDRGDSYVPTTSTARYLPRRGHHVYNGTSWVNEGLLHESEARVNLLVQSNDFTVATGAWNNINVTTTGTAQGPDGVSSSATQMLETASTSEHQVSETLSFNASTYYTLSVFVKSVGGRDCTLFWFTNSANTILQASFDLASGTVLSGPTASGSAPPTNISANIEKFGDFYRVSISGLVGATGGNGQARVHASDGATFNYLGDVAKGILIYGAQLEAASTPSSYIPTSGSTVTRAAETLTVPSAKLPWPTPNVIGPELVTNGTFDTDTTGWTAGNATLSVVSNKLQIVSDGAGIASASQTLSGLTVGQTYILEATGEKTVGASRAYATIYTGTGTFVDNAFSNVAVETTGTLVFVATQTSMIVRLQLLTPTAVGETGLFDNISVREIDPLAVSIQMQGKMTYADTDNAEEVLFLRWAKTENVDEIELQLRTTSGRTGEPSFLQRSGGVSDNVVGPTTTTYSPNVNVPFSIASRHGSTFINGAVDGAALTANTTPTALPDLSATDLNLGYDYMGTIQSVRVWAADLGDTGIEEASA